MINNYNKCVSPMIFIPVYKSSLGTKYSISYCRDTITDGNGLIKLSSLCTWDIPEFQELRDKIFNKNDYFNIRNTAAEKMYYFIDKKNDYYLRLINKSYIYLDTNNNTINDKNIINNINNEETLINKLTK